MFLVYVLYSSILNKFYIGSTSNLQERLKKHNSNHKSFTGTSTDWTLKYSETFKTKSESLKREKQIKNWKSRILIEKLIGSAVSAHPDL